MSGSFTPIRLRHVPLLLARFVRRPLPTIREYVTMTWPAIFALQAGSAMISGALAGAFNKSLWDFTVGIILFPITSVITGFLFSSLLYSFFSLFRATYLEFRKLHSIVALAMVPYFLLHTVASYLPPIDLIGFAFAALLIIVGLVDQFGVDRKIAVRVIATISAIFFVAWSAAQI